MRCPNCHTTKLVNWSVSHLGQYGQACIDCRLFLQTDGTDVRSCPLSEASFPEPYRSVPAYARAAGYGLPAADALRVGPDETLILKMDPDTDPAFINDLLEHLVDVGLAGRSLVIAGDVEMTVVKKGTEL